MQAEVSDSIFVFVASILFLLLGSKRANSLVPSLFAFATPQNSSREPWISSSIMTGSKTCSFNVLDLITCK